MIRRDLLKFIPFAPLVEFMLRVLRRAERPEIVGLGRASRSGVYVPAGPEGFDEHLFAVCYPDLDTMSRDDLVRALKAESSDVWMLERHVSRAYCWMTNDMISKPTTLPEAVIAVAEDIRSQEIDEAVKDELDAQELM